jgi:hypothetical protein
LVRRSERCQFKEGGTSLASPLLAGVVADADQAAGGSIGFLNPTLYTVAVSHAAAFNDIVPAANPNATAVIRVDFLNTVNKTSGYVVRCAKRFFNKPTFHTDPSRHRLNLRGEDCDVLDARGASGSFASRAPYGEYGVFGPLARLAAMSPERLL